MMKTIELHSYLGAFGPTDKYRPGFRTRDGTLLVLTHSKPYNKEFVLIPSKNIISEHFRCRTAYVYLCVADNQKATRYNNVPGGKISFFSHLNSLDMNFAKNIIVDLTKEQLGMDPNSSVSPAQVFAAFVPIDGFEEEYNSELSVAIREHVKAQIFAAAIQKAQVLAFLKDELQLEVEVAEENIEPVIEWINLYNESEGNDKADAANAIIQIVAPENLQPVDPAVVVETLEGKIAADEMHVPTGLIPEEDVVEETDTVPADSLQITPVQTTLVSNVPAGMLPVNASDLKEIYKDVDALEAGARSLGKKVREVIFNALDAVSGQAVAVEAEEAEDAQINL